MGTEEKKNVEIKSGKSRITWLDGLKGLACLFVFLSHFTTAIYPRLHFGPDIKSHTDKMELLIFRSPFQGAINVGIFCLVAGLLLCLKIMKLSDSADKMRTVGAILVKRYLRLMLPLIPVALFVWVALKFGLFCNAKASEYTFSTWMGNFYSEQMSLSEVLSSAIVKTWFYGDDALATSLWMMNQFFYGSVLSVVFGTIYWALKKKSVWIYLFTFVILIPRHDYVCGFALGAVLAYLYTEGYIGKIIQRLKKDAFWLPGFIGIVLTVLGFVIGGYPKDGSPIGFYETFQTGFYDCYYSVGAFLIVLGVWLSDILQKLFDSKVMQFLGSICYELFLVHIPILFSLGMWLWMSLYANGMNYHLTSFVTFVGTTAVIMATSYLYSRYISKWCGIVVNKVNDWLCHE